MKQRAFTIVVAILVTVLLAVIGFGLLASQSIQARGAHLVPLVSQARALAEAGMEDARVKLEKDPWFPFPAGDEQSVISYTEELSSISAPGDVLGSYTVTVDRSHRRLPSRLMLVTSVGTVGEIRNPRARYVLRAEYEVDTMEVRLWEEGSEPVP